MIYKKKNMGSFNLHMIKTDRFKTVNIEVIMRNKIEKEKITLTNFLSSILSYTTKKYPSKNKMALKVQDLYSPKIFPSCYRVGNFYNLDFNVHMLDEKYSEKGMLEETFQLLSDIIFDPNVDCDSFDKVSFDVVKNNEKSQIERLKEDPRKYSIIKMLEAMDSDKPYSYCEYGYMEDLEKITPSNLYTFYKEFMNKSVIDVFVLGNISFDEITKIVKEKLKFRIFRNNDDSPILEPKKARGKVQVFKEPDNTTQAKLSIGCTIDKMKKFEREYVLNLYNLILGATADSKFFKNIREKYSLCYYVSSIGNKLDNLFIITSGITKENLDKMLILINKEMTDMVNGNFTDTDIENAKKYYLSILDEALDRPNQIISSYYAVDLWGIDKIEKRREEILKVTKDDIMKFAKKVHMDTVFLLGGDKNEKENA